MGTGAAKASRSSKRWSRAWTGEHRIGRANLAAAFPEKPAEEIERILLGVWDNLGRVVAEFAHLDRLAVGDPHHLPYIHFDDVSGGRFDQVRDDGRPALVFAAHLANWELPAIMGGIPGRWGRPAPAPAECGCRRSTRYVNRSYGRILRTVMSYNTPATK